MKRTTLRAVTIDEKEWKAKGDALLKQAESVSKRTAKNDRHDSPSESALTEARNLSFMSEMKLTVLAGEAFKIAGESYDAAKAFSRAAALFHDSRAASYYHEAGIAAEKVNPTLSNDYFSRSVSLNCDLLEFKDAAKLLERMANNYTKKDELVASIAEFQRASALYKAAGTLDDADRTLGRVAYLQSKTGDITESSNSYKTLAMSQARRNTTIFNFPRYAMRSIILLLSVSESLSKVQDLIDEFSKEDCRFGDSRELEFIHDIMHSISLPDIDMFAECAYSYNEVYDLDDLMLESLERLMKKIVIQKADDNSINH